MPEENLLIKELLAESRSIREQLSDVQRDMVRKDDLQRLVDKDDVRLKAIEDKLDIHDDDIKDNNKFIGGMKWGIRVAGVALIGVIITGISSFVHVDFHSPTTTPAAAVQLSSPSPFPSPTSTIYIKRATP